MNFKPFGHPDFKPVLVETFHGAVGMEQRLNTLALDPTNRYSLEGFSHAHGLYTVILIWTPEEL